MNNNLFSATRDREMIEAGGFFCEACLVDKPLDDRSPDPRYCLGCYEFLQGEAGLLTRGKHPAWLPKPSGAKIAQKNLYQGVRYSAGIMSPIKDQKNKVDIITPVAQKVTLEKRGRKHRDLPEDLIRELASKGMGSKAISTRLKAEGVKVSYKTIQRRLQGVLI